MTTFGYRVFEPLETEAISTEKEDVEPSKRIEFTLRIPRFNLEAKAA